MKKITVLIFSITLFIIFSAVTAFASNQTFSLSLNDPGEVESGALTLTITPTIIGDNLINYTGEIILSDGLTNPILTGGTLNGAVWNGTTPDGWNVSFNPSNGRFFVTSPTSHPNEAVASGGEAGIAFSITLTANKTGDITIGGNINGTRANATPVFGTGMSRTVTVNFGDVPPTGVNGVTGYVIAMIFLSLISAAFWSRVSRRLKIHLI